MSVDFDYTQNLYIEVSTSNVPYDLVGDIIPGATLNVINNLK